MKNPILFSLVIFSILITSNTTHAQSRDGQYFYIKTQTDTRHTSYYLSTQNYSSNQNTSAVIDYQRGSLNNTARQWQLQSVSGGYYRLVQKKSKKALEVKNNSRRSGTSLIIAAKSNSDAQKFRLKFVGKDTYIIPKANQNLRLEVKGDRVGANIPVQVANRRNTTSQKWKLIKVPSENTTGKKAIYKVEVLTITCNEEDDSGSEIELYGNIKARVFYNGNDRNMKKNQTKVLWQKSESQAVDIRERQIIPVFSSLNFTTKIAYMQSNDYEIDLHMDLWEDDGSSGDDQFGYGAEVLRQWKPRILGQTQQTTLTEGDTEIVIHWKVDKVRDL